MKERQFNAEVVAEAPFPESGFAARR